MEDSRGLLRNRAHDLQHKILLCSLYLLREEELEQMRLGLRWIPVSTFPWDLIAEVVTYKLRNGASLIPDATPTIIVPTTQALCDSGR
jgi:hypothetical protein